MDLLQWIGLGIAALAGGFTALARIYRFGPFLDKIEPMSSLDNLAPEQPYIPASPPPVIAPSKPKPPPVAPLVPKTAHSTLLWKTPKQAWHSVRVLCDEMGLPLQKIEPVNGIMYFPKDIVCACIYQESQFNNNAIGRNKDPKTGKIWSTDWGLVQVNDTKNWHIGKGLRFSSVEDVLTNPEKAVRWVIDVYRTTGKLQLWASYTSGAYKKHLSPNSPMWLLKS